MFNHSRHGTPARSTKGTHVRRVIVAVAFATALPLAFATPSFAFTVRSFTARNATIQSQRPEGSCVYQVKYDFLPDPYNSLVATPFPSSYSLDVSVAAPIVSAMNLTSARDQQWVTYQAQLVDLTTGQITYGAVDAEPAGERRQSGLLHGWLTSHVWRSAPRKDVHRAEEVPA